MQQSSEGNKSDKNMMTIQHTEIKNERKIKDGVGLSDELKTQNYSSPLVKYVWPIGILSKTRLSLKTVLTGS